MKKLEILRNPEEHEKISQLHPSMFYINRPTIYDMNSIEEALLNQHLRPYFFKVRDVLYYMGSFGAITTIRTDV